MSLEWRSFDKTKYNIKLLLTFQFMRTFRSCLRNSLSRSANFIFVKQFFKNKRSSGNVPHGRIGFSLHRRLNLTSLKPFGTNSFCNAGYNCTLSFRLSYKIPDGKSTNANFFLRKSFEILIDQKFLLKCLCIFCNNFNLTKA